MVDLNKAEDEALRIVIVGAGIAGVSAAEEARKQSDKAEIVLISEEAALPYYRINLTRYLANEVTLDSLYIHPREWYESRRIQLLTGVKATEILAKDKTVIFDNGSHMMYERLILANGADPFIPPIPGSNLANVLSIRTIADVNALTQKMKEAESCICIGGGLLGIETAGAIVKSGIKVTLLEVAEWLMPRQLNKKASTYLKAYVEKLGISVVENVRIKEIIGTDACEGILLENGERLEAKLIVITAGIKPRTGLPKKTELLTNKGVIGNDYLETNEDDIFVAGDVSEHKGVVYGLWNVARLQGQIAAQNALGMKKAFEGVPPAAALKVLGLDLLSIGTFMPPDDSFKLCEKEEAERYTLFVLKDDIMTGSIILGDKSLAVKARQVIEKSLPIPGEAAQCADTIINRLIQKN